MSKVKTDLLSRRRALAQVALGLGLAYAAPAVAGFDMARASSASGGNSGANSGGSAVGNSAGNSGGASAGNSGGTSAGNSGGNSRGASAGTSRGQSRTSAPSRGAENGGGTPRWLSNLFSRG